MFVCTCLSPSHLLDEMTKRKDFKDQILSPSHAPSKFLPEVSQISVYTFQQEQRIEMLITDRMPQHLPVALITNITKISQVRFLFFASIFYSVCQVLAAVCPWDPTPWHRSHSDSTRTGAARAAPMERRSSWQQRFQRCGSERCNCIPGWGGTLPWIPKGLRHGLVLLPWFGFLGIWLSYILVLTQTSPFRI